MTTKVRVSNDEIIDLIQRYGFDVAFAEYVHGTLQDKVTQRLLQLYRDARRELAAHLCMEDSL